MKMTLPSWMRHEQITRITITCTLCGVETDRWTSVLWEDEQGGTEGIDTVEADSVCDFCLDCAAAIQEDVYDAVLAVVAVHQGLVSAEDIKANS